MGSAARISSKCCAAALVLSATVVGAILTPNAHGWGSGHRTQAQLVVDTLPGEVKDFFSEDLRRQIVEEYCGYPDAVRRFDEGLLGQEAVEELRSLKLAPGDLHQDLNTVISFVLLNRAFAEKHPRHAAVWLGSLIHTIGVRGKPVGRTRCRWSRQSERPRGWSRSSLERQASSC